MTDSHFSTFLSLCRLTATIKFSTVIFSITIPILDTRNFTLHKVYPIPIPHVPYFTFIKGISTYFLIDSTRTLHTTFDTNTCLQLWNEHFLCSINKFLKTFSTCAYQIFSNLNSTSCTTTTLPTTFEIWEQLADNQWLFSQSHTTLCQVIQPSGEQISTYLPLNGILTIPYQTTIFTDTHLFEGRIKYNLTLRHHIGNFSSFYPVTLEIPNLTLPLLDFNTKTLDSLEQRWNQEKQRIKDITRQEHTSTFFKFFYSLGLTQIIIIVIILLVIFFKLYKICKNKKNNSNINVILTTTPTSTSKHVIKSPFS